MADILKLDKKNQSQLDPGGVLKSAHDDRSQSLRVINGISEVPSSYSRVSLTYNASGSVTRAVFYEGTQALSTEIITVPDVSGSLNNTYFTLNSEGNESKYHVWFNVSSGGTDPAPAGSTGIEIPIETNDSSSIVAMAIDLCLKNLSDFKIQRINNNIKITNTRKGTADVVTDSGTNFIITTLQSGSEKILKAIDIPYNGVVRYLYNTQEKKFEVESVQGLQVEVDAADGDNIAISRHEEYRNLVFSDTKLDTDLSTTLYTNILNYTATEDLKIRRIKINTDTFGDFRVKIDGVIREYYRTSPLDRNCIFDFIEDENLLNTLDIDIEFKPERIRLSTYDFFIRIEAYV